MSLHCGGQKAPLYFTVTEPPNSLLFAPAVAPAQEKLTVSREMRLVFLQGLERDACFEKLRGEERFQNLIRKLADSLSC